jgi:hypothetical protein
MTTKTQYASVLIQSIKNSRARIVIYDGKYDQKNLVCLGFLRIPRTCRPMDVIVVSHQGITGDFLLQNPKYVQAEHAITCFPCKYGALPIEGTFTDNKEESKQFGQWNSKQKSMKTALKLPRMEVQCVYQQDVTNN